MTATNRDTGLPLEPLPEPFGVLWGRLWHDRQRAGEWKWSALVSSWKDARAISRLSVLPKEEQR